MLRRSRPMMSGTTLPPNRVPQEKSVFTRLLESLLPARVVAAMEAEKAETTTEDARAAEAAMTHSQIMQRIHFGIW